MEWLLSTELLIKDLMELAAEDEDCYCEVYNPTMLRQIKAFFPIKNLEEMSKFQGSVKAKTSLNSSMTTSLNSDSAPKLFSRTLTILVPLMSRMKRKISMQIPLGQMLILMIQRMQNRTLLPSNNIPILLPLLQCSPITSNARYVGSMSFKQAFINTKLK